MMEFDVRRTADGEFVVMHDAAVDRTTDGRGPVAELTFEEIRRLDAGGGVRVPSLAEALAYADRMILNIHAYPETDDEVAPTAEVLADHFRRENLYGRAFVASDREELQELLRKADPQIRLCNLTGQNDADWPEAAVRAGPCQVLQPRDHVTTPETVARAHAAGMKVNPYFADDEPEMRRLIDCDVDGILTNYPARLRAVLETLR